MTGSIEQLSRDFDITIRWRAFPLHPETPDKGQSLETLFNTDSERIQTMIAGLRGKAMQLGLDFGERSMTYNSRLAQELGLWAETQGKGHAFHMAAFSAYFAHGKNLAKRDVLLELVQEVGLPQELAKEVLDSRLFSEAVDHDWQLSRQMGITAVPTFVMGSSRLVGAQDYPALVDLVKTSQDTNGG